MVLSPGFAVFVSHSRPLKAISSFGDGSEVGPGCAVEDVDDCSETEAGSFGDIADGLDADPFV